MVQSINGQYVYESQPLLYYIKDVGVNHVHEVTEGMDWLHLAFQTTCIERGVSESE